MNSRQDCLSFALAEFLNKPLFWIAGVFACVASVLASAKWHYVAWDGAGAIWGSKCKPVIHVGGVEKSQNGPVAHSATTVEVVKGELPVIGGVVGGEFCATGSPSLSSHLDREWIPAGALKVVCAPLAAKIAAFENSTRRYREQIAALPAFNFDLSIQRVAFADNVCRSPVSIAPMIAKITMLIKVLWHYFQFRSALPTVRFNAIVVGAVLARQVGGPPLAHARVATKMILRLLDLARFATKPLSALGAFGINTIVMNGIFAGVKPLVTESGALKATVVLFVTAKLADLAGEFLPALRTSQLSVFNRLGLALAGLAARCKAVLFGPVALEVICCRGVELFAKVALLLRHFWDIMGLHKKFTFLLPSPGVLEHRQGNYFPALIIPQGAGK